MVANPGEERRRLTGAQRDRRRPGVGPIAPALGEFARALPPGGLLLLLGLLAALAPAVAEPSAAFLEAYPWLLPAAAACLAIAFRTGRGLFAIATVAAAVTLTRLFPTDSEGAEYARAALALLVPLNLAAAAALPDRAVLASGWRLAALGGQAGLVVLAWQAYWPGLLALPTARLVAAELPTRLPQPALFAFAAGGLVVLVAALRARTPVEAGLLWALTSAALAFGGPVEASEAVLLATATIVLAVAAVHSATASLYRDPLTGIAGRRALEQALAALPARATVAVADIDHFKSVNDTYGHEVGDQVLRMVAARLAAVRGGGRAYRFGGEEFVLLFPNRSISEIERELEAVRLSVESSPFVLRAPESARERPARRDGLAVTVSIGAAERARGEAGAEELLQQADAALYQAKDGGRNRLVCAGAAQRVRRSAASVSASSASAGATSRRNRQPSGR